MTRDRRFELLLTEDEQRLFQEEAELAGITLSEWARRCMRDVAAVDRVNRRHDLEARRRAARLHRLDPAAARELLSRNVPPARWPDPSGEDDERGRS